MTIIGEMTYKEQHDLLLASKPSDVEHDVENCPICNESEHEEGGDMSKTYTEDEVKALVAEALAPLQVEIETFKASREEAAIEEKVTAALEAQREAEVKPLAAKVEELQTELDTTTVRANAAETQYNDLVGYLEAEVAATETEKAKQELRDVRLEAVKDLSFSEDYINKAIDRWVDMAEEDFNALVEDWKAVSVAKGSDPLKKTAMTAGREATKDDLANVRDVFRAALNGEFIGNL